VKPTPPASRQTKPTTPTAAPFDEFADDLLGSTPDFPSISDAAPAASAAPAVSAQEMEDIDTLFG
jgi:hypothetical protein